MTKVLKQFYYTASDYAACKNNILIKESGVSNVYYQVINFGIQAPEGTKFYVNGDDYPCIIGKTGIFEWDVEGYGYITSLHFDNNTQLSNDEYIIVNICYLE